VTLMLALELVCNSTCSRWLSELLVLSSGENNEDHDEFGGNIITDVAIRDSYKLLRDILAESLEKPAISICEWERVLSYVLQSTVTISVPSIWAEACRDLTANDGWTQNSDVLREANNRWEEHVVDTVQLMDEPDYYFPPLECFMLLNPADCTFEHSCIPTHEVQVSNGNLLSLELVSHSDEEESSRDEEEVVTISLIDHEHKLEERRQLLALHGITSCNCLRCRFETNCQQSFSHRSLAKLLCLAKAQRRHEDAMIICNEMLSLDPTDSSALFDRARIAGWMGNFSLREQLLEKAAAFVSDGRIHAALSEARAYYRRDWDEPEHIDYTGQSHTYEEMNGLEGRAFVIEGLLGPEECTEMVNLAEEYQCGGGGWTTSRHYAVPTTDVPIYRMEKVLTWFNKQLEHSIFPVLRQQFKFSGRLRVLDAFFVKYDAAAGQKRLPLHNDQSIYSLTIAMNSTNDYEGGGTYFAETCETAKMNVGGMVSFEGDLLHAGRNIVSGTRYIIASFIYYEDNK